MDGSVARRQAAARWVLMGCGGIALAAFVWMPLLDAAPLYRVVLQPALGLSPELRRQDVEGLDHGRRSLLVDARLDELHDRVGEPVPLEPREGAPVVALTPGETWAVGRRLVVLSPELASLGDQTAVVARLLSVVAGVYVLLGLFCALLPAVPRLGPGSSLTIIGTGASALLLLAAHLTTVGFDLSGVTEPAFTWQSHVVSVLLVLGVGIGSAMPLTEHNALRCVLGTLGAFLISAAALCLYVAG